MALTDAQKRANSKYQAKTIASLACRVKKEQAEEFKFYCTVRGKTSNAVLKDYVLDCIGENTPETDLKTLNSPQSAGAVALPSDAIKTAQEAAEAQGEETAQFIERAITTQAERDRVQRIINRQSKKGGE